MRTLWRAALASALAAGLAGCVTEPSYPSYPAYPGTYVNNIFYCPSSPYAGFDCPGGFYYDNLFFPDRYAFFTYYHINRHHWKDFHGRRYWDRDDGDDHDGVRHHWNHSGATVREPGMPHERVKPFPRAPREFPGSPSFGAGHGMHEAPHDFGWRR